jgi:hypothetical protein
MQALRSTGPAIYFFSALGSVLFGCGTGVMAFAAETKGRRLEEIDAVRQGSGRHRHLHRRTRHAALAC